MAPYPQALNWNGGQNSYIQNYQNPTQGQQNQTLLNQGGNQNMQQNAQGNLMYSTPYPGIPGRMIHAITEVAAGEVPMTGCNTYFPTIDQNHIYALRWTGEGKLEKTVYVRQTRDQEVNSPDSDGFQMIMTRLDQMEKEIKRISRPRKRNTQTNQESSNEGGKNNV